GRAPARERTAGNSRSRGAARRRARPGKRGQAPFFGNQGQTPFFSFGWQHPARRLAEADRRMALARAAGALDHLVAVLDESPRFAARQLERRLAALGELEQRADRVPRRAGDGSRADQVARLQVAAVRAVVGDELRRRPVGAVVVAAREPYRRGVPGGPQIHLDLDREAGSGRRGGRPGPRILSGRWGVLREFPRPPPTRRGRGSRSAATCSSAAAGCRGGTACRRWWRGTPRCRSRCNRRPSPAGTTRRASSAPGVSGISYSAWKALLRFPSAAFS